MGRLAAASTSWTVREADFPVSGSAGDRARFLLRYAVLAPSTNHTQPWRFNVHGATIEVEADIAQWQRVDDRDQRELQLSLGCAIEHLVVAADHFGYRGDVTCQPVADRPALMARVTIEPVSARARRARPAGLFPAILARHTDRRRFTAEAVRPIHRRRLDQMRLDAGVRLWLSDAVDTKRAFDGVNRDATAAAYRDPVLRRELGDLVGDGVFGTAPLVSAFGRLALTYVDAGPGIARRASRRLASSPLMGLIATTSDTVTARVRAGQAFERLFLLATTLGLALQPMSRALEVPALRERVATLIPGRRDIDGAATGALFVQQAFRLGYPDSRPTRHTPRAARVPTRTEARITRNN